MHKVDDNQKEIVIKLRAIGASVVSLAELGGGVPDLLVGWRGQTYLFEIKQKTGKLRESQRRFMRLWRGQYVAVIRSYEEAFRTIGAMSRG